MRIKSFVMVFLAAAAASLAAMPTKQKLLEELRALNKVLSPKGMRILPLRRPADGTP